MTVRHRLSWLLVGGSLLLHLVTVFCFARQPDRLAAFTAFPLWFWGGIGLLITSAAFCLLRARLSLIMAVIWTITILTGSDEARVMGNLTKQAPRPGRAEAYHGGAVLRVATLNCHHCAFGSPAEDLAAWQPDIVLLQEIDAHQVPAIANALYQKQNGNFRIHHTNATITRWSFGDGFVAPELRNQLNCIILPSGDRIEVVNLHLSSAATDLRFWQPSAWRTHTANRALRRNELGMTLRILEQHTKFPNIPTLLGGDFNSGAADPVHRLLVRDFTDAFLAAGTGWGDTFQRRVPVLRIDHIYANSSFTPIRCRAVTTVHSDHRMVIADFLTKFPLR